MTTFSIDDARRDMAAVLDEAARAGGAALRGADGRLFIVRPADGLRSPLDVPGVATELTAAEIVAAVREGRERPAE